MKRIALSLAAAFVLASGVAVIASEANAPQSEGDGIRNVCPVKKNHKKHCKARGHCQMAPCVANDTCRYPECQAGQRQTCPFSPEVCPQEEGGELRPCPAGPGAPAADCCFQRPPRRDNRMVCEAKPFNMNCMQGIELTPAQQKKISELKAKQQEKRNKEFKKNREKRDKMNQDAMKKRDQMRASYEKELKNILTPEQYLQFQQNKAKQQEMRGDKRGKRGHKQSVNRPGCEVKRVRPAAQPPMQYGSQPETAAPAGE